MGQCAFIVMEMRATHTLWLSSYSDVSHTHLGGDDRCSNGAERGGGELAGGGGGHCWLFDSQSHSILNTLAHTHTYIFTFTQTQQMAALKQRVVFLLNWLIKQLYPLRAWWDLTSLYCRKSHFLNSMLVCDQWQTEPGSDNHRSGAHIPHNYPVYTIKHLYYQMVIEVFNGHLMVHILYNL